MILRLKCYSINLAHYILTSDNSHFIFVPSERSVPNPGSVILLPLAVGCPVRYSGPNLWTALLLRALRHPGALVSTSVCDIGGGNRPTEEGDSKAAGDVSHGDGPIAELHCGDVESTISIVSFFKKCQIDQQLVTYREPRNKVCSTWLRENSAWPCLAVA